MNAQDQSAILLFDREMWYTLVLCAHVLAGIVALFVLWIPLATAKGSSKHIAAGRTFLGAVFLTVVSALIMCYMILTKETIEAEKAAFAFFLIYISILTLASGWYGYRVLQFKERHERNLNLIDVGTPLLLAAASVAMCLGGIYQENSQHTLFPVIGLFLGYQQLSYWLSVPQENMHWWYEHMNGMFATVIGTLTAFCVTAVPRLFNLHEEYFLLWFAPTIVFVPILIFWQQYYRRFFNQ